MKKVSKKGLIGMALVVVAVILVGGATALLADKETSATMVEDEVASLQKVLDESSDKVPAEQSARDIFTFPGGCYFAYLLSETGDPAGADKVNEFGFYYPCLDVSEDYHPNGCCALYRLFDGPDKAGSWTFFNTTDYCLDTRDDFGVWLNSPTCHQDKRRQYGGLYHSEQSCGTCDKFEHFKLSKMELPKGTMIGECEVRMAYIVNIEDWCTGGDADYDDMVVALVPLPPDCPYCPTSC